MGSITVGIEAMHIKWHQARGPVAVDNGYRPTTPQANRHATLVGRRERVPLPGALAGAPTGAPSSRRLLAGRRPHNTSAMNRSGANMNSHRIEVIEARLAVMATVLQEVCGVLEYDQAAVALSKVQRRVDSLLSKGVSRMADEGMAIELAPLLNALNAPALEGIRLATRR